MTLHKSFSWLDGHSKPGPKKDNIKVLKDENLDSQPHLGLTEVIATKLAIEALNKYERKHASLLVPHMPKYYLKELPYQVFDEIDKELFRGVLQKNVYLRWSSLPPYVHGKTNSAGYKNKRVTIELNKTLIQMGGPPGLVLASLIHHMAHAYFLVCCGPRTDGSDAGKDAVGHGLGFSSLIHKIKDVFMPRSKHRFPDLFTCYSGDPNWRYASSRIAKKKRGRQNSSICCWGLRDYPNKKTCEDYLKGLQEISACQKKESRKGDKPSVKGAGEKEKGKEGKDEGKEKEKEKTVDPYPRSHYLHTVNTASAQFTPVLRAQYSLKPSDYIEIHYQNYAIPIPRRNLNNFPSLLQKFAESKDPPVLTAPNSTPTSIFLALYSYIFEFDYPPSLKPVISATLGAKAGPPVIETPKPGDPPYLLTDIQVFTLASKLRFGELRSRALGRLYAQSVTRSDPMAALEKIYQGKEIEVEEDKHALRAWARAFLSKTRSGGQATNLAVLQRSEQWKSRFAALRLRGGEFLADCDAANEGIAVKAALMKIVGGSKHGSPQNSGSGNQTTQARQSATCDHHPQKPFSVPNPSPPDSYDLDPDNFDLYGLASLGQSSRCSSPDCSDSSLPPLHQLPPSILHQLHGHYPGPYTNDEGYEHDRKRKMQESPPPANNPFGNRNQGAPSASSCCNKCARN